MMLSGVVRPGKISVIGNGVVVDLGPSWRNGRALRPRRELRPDSSVIATMPP